MKFSNIIKNNAKMYIIMLIIIILGTMGITFAISVAKFNDIDINSTALNVEANINYNNNGDGTEIVGTNNLLPISDELVTGPDITDTRVLKTTFSVIGSSNNPDNTIYDIALHDITIDCIFRTNDLKWRLYKENSLLSEGTLSPEFDTMSGDRLVLTNTQEDLTENTDNYTFLLWISESCPGDVKECASSLDQSKYLGKTLTASIKAEVSTGSKKDVSRITGSEGSCSYTEVEVPYCNNLTYNGQEQTIINTGSNYTLMNNSGVNAGVYSITATLDSGYKWSNGSTDSKVLTCNIGKRDVTITTLDQGLVYGSGISSQVSNVSANGLLNSDKISSVNLEATKLEVGVGSIITNGVKIENNDGNDVTSNYNIIKKNTGVLTLSCSNIAEEPTITSYQYTGSELTGVTGGAYVTINGIKSATEAGEYKVEVTPNKNYCWSDNTTVTKEYSWSITSNYIINLNVEEVDEVGTSKLYGKVGDGLYLDSEYNNKMTTSKNPIIIPTKTGYTFGGYFTEEDGAGTKLINENGYITDLFTSDLYDGDVTLYAKWTANSYTIQFYDNLDYISAAGSKLVTLNGRSFYKENAGGALVAYVYDTVYTGPVLVSTNADAVAFSQTYDSTITNYAGSFEYEGLTYYYSQCNYWMGGDLTDTSGLDRRKYSVTRGENSSAASRIVSQYLLEDNNSSVSQSFTYGTSQGLTLNTYTKTGYTFVGWSTSPTGEVMYTDGQNISNLTSENGEVINLYAIWRENIAYIRYNTNGGTITASTTGGTFSTDNGNIIYKNGNVHTTSIMYGGIIDTDGLNDYNNSAHINISKTGYSAVSGSEWMCMSGCITSNATYNQATASYVSSDFCDASQSDCTVILGVNWTPNSYTATYNANGGILSSTSYTTSGEKTYVISTAGNYKLEVWGAQGGSSLQNGSTGVAGGYGGYAVGTVNLAAGTSLYVNVGGKGANGVALTTSAGGYNGGGSGTSDGSDDETSGGGGGATHIATVSGLLSSLSSTTNRAKVLIVAGGGGGASWNYAPGHGGGYYGGTTTVTSSSYPTQSSGYAFGQGQNASGIADNDGVGGGGGGWYGGYSNDVIGKSSGTGGSGYIGNSSLTNKAMYCYSCPTSTAASTLTYSVSSVSSTPTANSAKSGSGAAKISSLTQEKSVTYDAEYGTLPTPTRSGYVFDGWYTASSGGTRVTETTQISTAGNHTLYAVWKINTYTITYNANGGSGAPAAQTKSAGTNLTLSNTKPTRTGYTFLGWSTSSTATSATYSAGGTFTTDADTTLYAVWKINTYTINYNVNGGTGTIASQTKIYGVDLTLSKTTPTRTGYTFLGWSTSSTATSATYKAGDTYNSNASATLYAVWKSKYTNAYVNGKSDCFTVAPNDVEPNSFWTVNLNVCWKETYNAYKNTSKVSITGINASLSDYYGYTFYLGGGQGETNKGIYVNGSLLTTMSYHTGGYSVYFGSLGTYYPVSGSFPMTSGEIAHNSDGTKTVPIRVYLAAARSGYTTGYYSSFDSTVNITLTDTR